MQNVKFALFFSCVSNTFNAFPTTVIFLHLLFALHSPFRNSGLIFHCGYVCVYKFCTQNYIGHQSWILSV